MHLIDSLDPADLLLIVVGAHPRAESADRPVAYWLLEKIRERQAALATAAHAHIDGLAAGCGLDEYPSGHAGGTGPTGGGGGGAAIGGSMTSSGEAGGRRGGRRPLVCSDVWFLNDDSLRNCPVIAVGGPRVNALSAYLGDKLPGALVIDGVLMVQLDIEFAERSACCWGESTDGTLQAVELFCEKYLDGFLHAANG